MALSASRPTAHHFRNAGHLPAVAKTPLELVYSISSLGQALMGAPMSWTYPNAQPGRRRHLCGHLRHRAARADSGCVHAGEPASRRVGEAAMCMRTSRRESDEGKSRHDDGRGGRRRSFRVFLILVRYKINYKKLVILLWPWAVLWSASSQ